jgi:LytS/YehU family sensor histidine kinase
VADTGAGLSQTTEGLGSGLATLRERLRLIFGDDAHLRIGANAPRGTVAEIDLPASA